MFFKIFFSSLFCFMSLMSFSQKNIFDVARNGTVDEVKKLMIINPDTINKSDTNGYMPLTLACYRGNSKVASFLAERVADIDAGSKYGTPLMAAVFKDENDLVATLLNMKANPDLADVSGTAPLHYAAMKQNDAIVKLLVEAHADINLKDNKGRTALDYAKISDNKKIIELLNKIK